MLKGIICKSVNGPRLKAVKAQFWKSGNPLKERDAGIIVLYLEKIDYQVSVIIDGQAITVLNMWIHVTRVPIFLSAITSVWTCGTQGFFHDLNEHFFKLHKLNWN